MVFLILFITLEYTALHICGLIIATVAAMAITFNTVHVSLNFVLFDIPLSLGGGLFGSFFILFFNKGCCYTPHDMLPTSLRYHLLRKLRMTSRFLFDLT